MWKKEPPIKAKVMGCATCGELNDKAPMDMVIAVGLGDAHVQKDKELVYEEPVDSDDFWTVEDAEKAAEKDPDHDWRIVMFGPLRGRVFQRHAPGEWMLIEENEGFA